MPRRLVAAVAVTAGAAGIGLLVRRHRHRVERGARLARLGARRAAGFASHRARRLAATEARRQQMDADFLIRSAEDVARELGHMKGAMMKAGQMLSFIIDGLPEQAQQSLASLQQNAPAMAPSLAARVVRDELGADPTEVFRTWSEVPVAAASIGQVHRATLPDGREVAVKVQYPGVGDALESDLSNAQLLYALFSSVTLKSLDVEALVDELRRRMLDELDYRLEASCQTDFADRYADHPFVRIPRVVPSYSSARVLTTEWAEGDDWDRFLARATEAERQQAAEVLFRFIQGAIYRAGVFNGDPHPGNYRFGADGTVTFLDFGLVKRWAPGELESLLPLIDPLLDRDHETLLRHMESVGFLAPDHGLDPGMVWEYVSRPYLPYLDESFTFTPAFTTEVLATLLDLSGPYKDVMNSLDMPASFVVLDRVVWGMSALLGRLGATNRWRAILDEYRLDAPPSTALGRAEAAWREARR
ncbi:MAG: AarF/ABC1/UbiB kinase family protein [Acidimicrobiia bacterium]|nr:AarF/ABC1/UbiB kinase family protein [Acidimicrobiia bacterium]MDH5235990.1 AarF/ABC1/UbiB kinase family protein [Acidimicrobiia bacterium]